MFTRLSTYLARVFGRDLLALFGVVVFLLFLIQCLRIFDVVSVKGQSIIALFGHAALTMPPLAVVFFYVCMGIGLARGLRALQASQELHIIHTNQRVPALLGGVALYTALGTLFVLVMSNFLEPMANRRFNEWSASIAADLVGRTLTPHRFTEVVPGVMMVIGGRLSNGEITHFFADDRRDPATRRTYIADSAVVARDEEGYVLQLQNGALQYMSQDQQFSMVSFGRYDVGLDVFIEPGGVGNDPKTRDSLDIASEAAATGVWSDETVRLLVGRLGEGLRVIAMCVLVTALTAFPHARRRRFEAPIEFVVLAAAFVERGISAYAGGPPLIGPIAGALGILALGVPLLLMRMRPRRLGRALAVPG